MNVLYNVYDEKEKKDMGNYSAKEIRAMLKIKDVSTYARTYSRAKNRYVISRVEERTIGEILEEWDDVTKRIRDRKSTK